MIIVYTPDHQAHHPTHELYDGTKTPYPEVPERIENIAAALRTVPHLKWSAPQHMSDRDALGLHTNHYVSYLKILSTSAGQGDIYPSNFIHDTYAPVTAGTFSAARSALDTVLTAAAAVRDHEPAAYALSRPPGHHAGDGYMGGYCYFNNAGAAAELLSKHGTVAILDVDYHHGNGTQALFYDRSDVAYVSVHADPAVNYPYTHGFSDEVGVGKGHGFTHNIVVAKDCDAPAYFNALEQALLGVRNFAPDYLVVSLGFDGFRGDPIAGFGLDVADFATMAEQIAGLRLPTLFVQEGGYNVAALGELASTFVTAFMARHQISIS